MWNNLWSVSRYVMGPLSGRWRQSGNDQQCLAAPIWKYRSGFGDHRFNFFIDLRPNYTFYTNLTNIVDWVVAYRDVAHLVRLDLGKSWEKSAKSFDAGLSSDLTLHKSCLNFWLKSEIRLKSETATQPSLTHLPLMPYICASELGQHWFGLCLVACSAPSHYQNQSCLNIKWTTGSKFQWNLSRNSIIFVQENAFEIVVCQHGGHFVQGET